MNYEHNDDPNTHKNRVPVGAERAFLVLLINDQEAELSRTGSSIVHLQTIIDKHRAAVKECQFVLDVARRMESLAKRRVDLISEMDTDVAILDEEADEWTTPQTPALRSIYREMMNEKLNLEEQQIHSMDRAQELSQEATGWVYRLEEELDANNSMLAVALRSHSFLLGLKTRIEAELAPKKELVGARRLVPVEIWTQIFMESVLREEEEYKTNGRDGLPPFTPLKLSWICRFWRAIVHDHPPLWKYVAIPRAAEISRSQWNRVDFYRDRSRGVAPIVYVVPDSRGEQGSTLRQFLLLQQYHRFEQLELRISRRTSEAEDILAAIEPRVDELVLIGAFKSGSSGTSCPLRYRALANVQSIRCIDIHPTMRISSPYFKPSPITSIFLKQPHLEPRAILQFFNVLPVLESISIELYSWSTIEGDHPLTPLTLPNVSKINASALVLIALFPNDVHVPALKHITLKLMEGEENGNLDVEWEHFVSLHGRRESIQSLTLTAPPLMNVNSDIAHIWARMVQALPHTTHLQLFDFAAGYVLEGLTTSRQLPPHLLELTLSSGEITEENVLEFMKAYYANNKAPLTLRLDGCLRISPVTRVRLIENGGRFSVQND